jgi:hypothetical protein
MKKYFLSAVLLASVALTAFSQTNVEEVDFYQSVFGMAKRTMVSDFIDLGNYAEADFWQLYDAYEVARKDLGKKRLELLDIYAKAYMILNDTRTDEIIKDMATQKKNLDKLILKYYKKMSKTVGIKPAAQFYQLENYLLSAIRLEILDNIPFIGEM